MSKSLTDERKAKIRRAIEATERGPWFIKTVPNKSDAVFEVDMGVIDFICIARTAIPELLDEVERLSAQLKQAISLPVALSVTIHATELMDKLHKAESLAADGEKYRRLCKILDRFEGYFEIRWGSFPRPWARLIMGRGQYEENREFETPDEALEAAVKKAEEVTNDA